MRRLVLRLKENGLEVIEDMLPVSARLIVNIASMKLRKAEVEAFIQKVEADVKSRSVRGVGICTRYQSD